MNSRQYNGDSESPSLRKRRFTFVFALTLLSLIGAGQGGAVIQFVAWGTMLVRYSQSDGIQAGIQDTFSGERPCGLCRIAQSIDAPIASIPRSTTLFPPLLLPLSVNVERERICRLSTASADPPQRTPAAPPAALMSQVVAVHPPPHIRPPLRAPPAEHT